MPVNPLPILVPLLLLWAAMAYLLMRWRRWAGGVFVGLSIIALTAHIMSTGVERRFDEQMTFRVIELRDYRLLELTNSRGETVTVNEPGIVDFVRTRHEKTVRVTMVGWYDYGRLNSYRVLSVDGAMP